MLTQSIVKLIESCCPRLAQEEIANRPPSPPGSPMEKGSYFETLCLGSGVRGQQTTTLPSVRGGKKSADQERIEKQAERFKNMFDPLHPEWNGRIITDTQVEIEHNGRGGTIDFLTEGIIWDLKLTGDVTGYWGNLDEVDFLQQIHYQHIWEQKYGERLEMRLLIFDYSTKMNIKEVKVNISEDATYGAIERFDKVEELMNDWGLLDEYPRIPDEKDCSRCPLICDKRVIKNNIIFEEYEV